MTNTKLNRTDILDLKSKLKRRKRNKKEELLTIEKFIEDQNDYIKTSFIDYDNDAFKIRTKEMLMSMKRRAKNKLTNYDSALKKIKSGKYGICEKTGGNISPARLMAMPEARTCINNRK